MAHSSNSELPRTPRRTARRDVSKFKLKYHRVIHLVNVAPSNGNRERYTRRLSIAEESGRLDKSRRGGSSFRGTRIKFNARAGPIIINPDSHFIPIVRRAWPRGTGNVHQETSKAGQQTLLRGWIHPAASLTLSYPLARTALLVRSGAPLLTHQVLLFSPPRTRAHTGRSRRSWTRGGMIDNRSCRTGWSLAHPTKMNSFCAQA